MFGGLFLTEGSNAYLSGISRFISIEQMRFVNSDALISMNG